MATDDRRWMRRCLELARAGFSGASPNPYVGCVVVKRGRAVGEGAHVRFGGPHAEAEALRRAGRACSGATLYVNLEPCCHWGKTPPCADAIARAGVRRVVAAVADPNPLVRGGGFARLRRAGVAVTTGVCAPEARELNRSFFKFVRRNRPYLFLKSALSLDGRTATAGGESQWITSPQSRRAGHRLRAQVDAVLVGAETVRRDDPGLTSRGQGRDPVRVVLTASGKLPARARIFDGRAPTWIFSCAPRRWPRAPKLEAILCRGRSGRIPFAHVLRELARRGVSRLLVEGGARTAAEALESKSVDEIVFFLAPILIGGGRPAIAGRGCPRLAQAPRLAGWKAVPVGPDYMVTARVRY